MSALREQEIARILSAGAARRREQSRAVALWTTLAACLQFAAFLLAVLFVAVAVVAALNDIIWLGAAAAAGASAVATWLFCGCRGLWATSARLLALVGIHVPAHSRQLIARLERGLTPYGSYELP